MTNTFLGKHHSSSSSTGAGPGASSSLGGSSSGSHALPSFRFHKADEEMVVEVIPPSPQPQLPAATEGAGGSCGQMTLTQEFEETNFDPIICDTIRGILISLTSYFSQLHCT